MNKNIFFKIGLIAIILIATFLPASNNKGYAYNGGLLDGKQMKIASTYTSTTAQETPNLTDNDTATSYEIGLSGSSNDTVFYIFPADEYIESFKININGDARITFMTSSNAVIEIFNSNSNEGINKVFLSSIDKSKVRKIMIENVSTVTSPIVNEFDVYRIPAPPPGLLKNRILQGYAKDGKTATTTVLDNFSDGNPSTSTSLQAPSTTNTTTTVYADFSLDSPTDLTEFRVLANAFAIKLELYDTNNNLISTHTGTNTYDYQVIPLNAQNVKRIRFYPTTGTFIFEAELYGTSTTTTTPGDANGNSGTTVGVISGNYNLVVPTNINMGNVMVADKVTQVSKPIGFLETGDLTGTAQGWRLQVQATPFRNDTDSFPMNSLILNQPSGITPLNGATSPPPIIASGYPWYIDNGNDITILSAKPNEGMASYSVDFSSPTALTLTVPIGTKTGSYSGTITWKIVVGP